MIINARHLRKVYLLALLIAGITTLSACGSSTPSGGQEATSSRDWDSMRWDQGTWN
jgi:hypothetical protein